MNRGGGSSEDRYNNVFRIPTDFTVFGETNINVALQTTTFNTTVGGSAASGVFDIQADYLNRGGLLKTKTITTITSDAAGIISVPLPTHRDDRQENILSFDAFYFIDIYEQILTAFDPLVSPVIVALPAEYAMTFTVTAEGTAVEGIYVGVGDKTMMTDAQGQVIIELPEGTHNYSVFSKGSPESFRIGGVSYTYQDMGGNENRVDPYDNIFVANESVSIAGDGTVSVDLPFTNFKTRMAGVDASASFDVIAEYDGGKIKTIAELSSDASGNISIPLPTHRNDRRGDTLAFSFYQYWALGGIVNDTFQLTDNPVAVDFPVIYETTFNVESGGAAVEGISINVDGEDYLTNASGQVVVDISAGDHEYMVYTSGSPEIFSVGDNTFLYNDTGENGYEDRYDNIFVNTTAFSITGASTVSIFLPSTTFHTTLDGSTASVNFNIIGEYTNRRGFVKSKTITNLSSDESGTISLPLPTFRNDQYGNVLSWDTLYTSNVNGDNKTVFDPLVSPVNLALTIPATFPVDFTINAGGNPVQGIFVSVAGLSLKTDVLGKCRLEIPEGDHTYSVYSGGVPESFKIGGVSHVYEDMGGRDGSEDSYENIFVANTPLTISGASLVTVDLDLTTFKTRIQGVDASASFSITAEHVDGGSDIKTITELTSNASGDIALPLPTHRSTRRGDTIDFSNYMYLAVAGSVSGTFAPGDNPVIIDFPVLHEITFNVESGGIAVEGISIGVNEEVNKTDAAGQLVLHLPAGDFMYYVYTGGTPETIVVGDNTFIFEDEGGSGRIDAFDNVFMQSTPFTVTTASTMNISLASTTFHTSMEGTAASIEFNLSAGYINRSDEVKRKNLTTLVSDESGLISIPLPTHRDDRTGDTLEYYNFLYSDQALSTQGMFDPDISPVEINFPSRHDFTFTILAAGTPVQGMYVVVNDLMTKSNASGQVVLTLPDGDFDYMLMTEGVDETLMIGGQSFRYLDFGGDGDEVNRYDNIFKRGTITVDGGGSISISLLAPAFMTTIGGTAVSAMFAIKADYNNNSGDLENKTLIQLESDAAGNIVAPLPSHRTSRQGPILEFINYSYADLMGLTAMHFDPNDSPVLVALPAANEVVFMITSGGKAVGGMTLRFEDLQAVSDNAGMITLNLPEGPYKYFAGTMGSNESLTIDGNTFNYQSKPGRENDTDDPYDNVFHFGQFTVSGASTENIDIGSTTFETTVNGSPAPVSVMIEGDYYNRNDRLKTKDITTFTTDASGNMALPVPRYRDDRRGSLLTFISYSYMDISRTAAGLFNPMDSPVQIAFMNLNQVVFNVTSATTSNPLKNAVVWVDGATLNATDEFGETSTALATGSYNYAVTLPGYWPVESTAFDVSGATTIDVVMDVNVGIEDHELNKFAFYPNPASDILYMNFTEPYSGSIDIYSITGRLIRQFQVENELSGTFEISDLEDGFYILKAGSQSERLLVK